MAFTLEIVFPPRWGKKTLIGTYEQPPGSDRCLLEVTLLFYMYIHSFAYQLAIHTAYSGRLFAR